ncbi:MAG: mycothiol synthase [Chloroflexota bacterium]|nr:mycothiol synthase [Chloroflexota bacterium]
MAPLPVQLAAPPTLDMRVVRRLTPDLQRQVDQLADAAQAVDGVRAFGEHKWLRLVRGDDRCAAILAWQGRALVAAAHCDAYHTSAPDRPCRLTAELVVEPRWRGRGLGRALLAAIVGLAQEEVAQELQAWAYGSLPAARRLADAFALRPERRLLQYTLSPERLPLSADIPVSVFDPAREANAWLELHNRVFAGHPERGTWDMSDLQARLEQPWFDARDVLITRDGGGEILGFCWVKLPVDPTAAGEIYIVGVAPHARGRGLGRSLTQAGLAHIRARGRPGATLYVEADNEPAIRLYEGLGFEQRFEHVLFARAL